MKYLSLCSGIEAATVAWHPLGWEAVAYSEIERFPSEVLAHHYPSTPNLGDMTKFKEWTNVSDVDVLVGGTPCQSFSVAGLRKGLDDPRGNLMLTYLAIARQYSPRWLVWENVPGVLSSNRGLDFASLLRGMGELGYGFAYRVLDAQYFGVAQRRRRVFVVGYLGDWRAAAAVLFERHSLQGHPAPSREKRQGASIHAGKGIADCSPTIGCELAKQVNNQMIGNAEAFFIPDTPMQPIALAGSLDTECGGGKLTHQSVANGHIVPAKPQWWDGGDLAATITTKSDDQRMPDKANAQLVMQPVVIDRAAFNQGANAQYQFRAEHSETMDSLVARGPHTVLQPIPIHDQATRYAGKNGEKTIGKGNGLGIGHPGEPMNTLTKGDRHAVAQPIAFSGQMSNPQTDVDMTQTLQAKNPMAVAFTTEQTPKYNHDQALTLTKQSPTGGGQPQCVMQSMAVRRLTPVECERLQGFGDNYTDIKSKNKPTPDGPRYKALGNSMAVPVMAWIGERIEQVEAICKQNK